MWMYNSWIVDLSLLRVLQTHSLRATSSKKGTRWKMRLGNASCFWRICGGNVRHPCILSKIFYISIFSPKPMPRKRESHTHLKKSPQCCAQNTHWSLSSSFQRRSRGVAAGGKGDLSTRSLSKERGP